MTTGSWSTLRATRISTYCSAASDYYNGMTVTWNGADSVVRRRDKAEVRKLRDIVFLSNPRRVPYTAARGFKLDPARVATMFTSRKDSIFDHARSKRMTVLEEEPPKGDYRYPHVYNKSWQIYDERPLVWWAVVNPAATRSGTVSNCGFGPQAIANPWTPEQEYKLLSRLRKKTTGTDFNLGTFLGAEGWDTVRFMTDTANVVYRAGVAAKNGDFFRAHDVIRNWGRYHPRSKDAVYRARQEDVYRDILEALAGKERGKSWSAAMAGNWLNWQLAVQPLLGDVVAAAEQLAHIITVPRTQRVRASVRVRVPYPAKPYTGPIWSGFREVRKGVVAYFTHTPDPLDFMGFQDPEVVIWNALPLSFVFDWALNVGGWLEALAAKQALPPGLFVTSTKDQSVHTDVLGTNFQGSAKNQVSIATQKQYRASGTFNRSVSSLWDVPKPRLVGLKEDPTWQRAVTVFSLFTVFKEGAKAPPLR